MDCEQAPLLGFVREAARFLDKRFRPDGYSIGVNVGEAAGRADAGAPARARDPAVCRGYGE
ncbi:hypothetical protein [Methanoculleus methanifontis]|uniref:hypothetical protein n=1 Tax=Methanoculleus methanifontis TaxID=2584086 RepID=UPI00265A7660|nr:hypothetical protein [Methanoculleus sp. FWC-SCC3]